MKKYQNTEHAGEAGYGETKPKRQDYIEEPKKYFDREKEEEKPVVKEAPPAPRIDMNVAVRDQDENLGELKLKTEMVTGSLFDRVRFLEERIAEMRKNVEIRKAIHREMTAEIEEEILDKKDLINMTLENDDKRNIKMDISLLKKERRNENVRFWKDLVELSVELRELLEHLQTEKKIAGLFEGLGGKE